MDKNMLPISIKGNAKTLDAYKRMEEYLPILFDLMVMHHMRKYKDEEINENTYEELREIAETKAKRDLQMTFQMLADDIK